MGTILKTGWESYLTSLNQHLLETSQRIDNFFKTHLPAEDETPTTLHTAMRYSALGNGKRIRPALVYATANALHVPHEHLDIVAAAIELMHCYSLIHDDLPAMDDDDLRRGKPTCHKAFDEATAILAGDAMQALAFDLITNNSISGPSCEIRAQLTSILAQTVGSRGMAGGQAMDLAVVNTSLTINQLEQVHRKKTGCLIHACINMAQVCTDSLSMEKRQGLLNFADNLGIAFQIRDDILDEISDTQTLGKPQGSDKLLNKPTYVSMLGCEESERLCQNYYQDALDNIASFDQQADTLRMLAEHIVCRKH